ncbi:dNTP triphosphohydrolase [Duganella sp. FT50W]|uniref:Deoxyguanosinetriphosphate triphosphohydrolase-like protein n=1 Tax=Duganella lactea TaxID=2692173 RepID=A0A6L8MDK4_9BURK|nr:anti-phage deoxyguanosine triphosphatase [Duganella lactea]MYM80474.1 dNTP triphosphohydrolase [Duganella lactea]
MTTWEARLENANQDARIRDNYSRDRARIIHSAFFRRLQGKTQVLGLGESDFYRTRLTHSIEVAQIASGIVEHLESQQLSEDQKQLLPSANLIESIALAHDIGHPPFGHGGEVALNYVMRDDGGFEGNAQTLRICTKLGEYSDDNGLNLTRRTLLGLLKYPATYSSTVNVAAYGEEKSSINLDAYKPPKCVFDCDSDSLDFILQPVAADRPLFQSVAAVNNKHQRTMYKALDTSIMELADDIAYGVHDLEDAVALSLVKERQWNLEVTEKFDALGDASGLKPKIADISANLFSGLNKTRKKAISELVGYFIRSTQLTSLEKFQDPLLDTNAVMFETAKKELKILQGFVVDHVIKTAEVQTLEYKGQQMIVRLFEAIDANPQRLLPEKYAREYQEYHEKKQHGQCRRVICDYIAGTTDDYASRLYHKIFTPSSGSIFDRL